MLLCYLYFYLFIEILFYIDNASKKKQNICDLHIREKNIDIHRFSPIY